MICFPASVFDGFNLSAFNFHFEKDVIRAQVTSVLYKAPSFSHTWKSTRKAPPHTQAPQKNKCIPKTVFNHNKLCIYYANWENKSFTDSSLIVFSIQGMVTNCKGICNGQHLARQWMLKREMWQHWSDLTWCSMRKETCTNNELGEFLMISGYWKAHRTQHTEKCKGKKASLPTIDPPNKQ